MSKQYFLDQDFSHRNLSGLDLSHCKLRDCNFDQAIATGLDLSDSSIIYCSFFDSSLKDTNLSRSKITGALSCTCLANSNLTDAKIDHSILSLVDLSGADLTGAMFRQTKLNMVNLANTKGLSPITLRSAIVLDKGRSLEGTLYEPLSRGEIIKADKEVLALCDPRGYILSYDGELFYAGCRVFYAHEAFAHWSKPSAVRSQALCDTYLDTLKRMLANK